MTNEQLAAEIDAEAERIRTDGTLTPSFEAEMQARFDAIARDPGALEREVAERAATAGAGGQGAAKRLARRARKLSRRSVASTRRRVGPRIRAVERSAVERAGSLGESASVRYQVVLDRIHRVLSGPVPSRTISRVLGAGPERLVASAAALRLDADGHLGDRELDSYLEARVLDGASSYPVLHVESGNGSLVARAATLGLDARGRDPRHGSGGMGRSGALEAIAAEAKGSLGAIVVTGVSDRVTPRSARALASLSATRLVDGGIVVVLSTHPAPVVTADPVASDLSDSRSLHPVTWCHLFARLGLEEIAVRESAQHTAYAVSARRRQR